MEEELHFSVTFRRKTVENASIVCEKRGIPMMLFRISGSSRMNARTDIADEIARFAASFLALERG